VTICCEGPRSPDKVLLSREPPHRLTVSIINNDLICGGIDPGA